MQDLWKDCISQTIWPLGQSMLNILEKCNKKPYLPAFYKSWSFFSKRTVWDIKDETVKDSQNRNKTWVFDGNLYIYKESLKDQYGSDCQTVFFWSKFAKKYWKTRWKLMNENLVERTIYNHCLLWVCCSTLFLEYIEKSKI